MIFALLFFAALALVAVIVPAVLVGFIVVVASRRLPLWARSVLLPVLSAGSALLWPWVTGTGNYWWPAAVLLSFAVTCTTGAVFLLLETRRRHRPRHGAVWMGYPSATPGR
ncbi:hypothetical protein AB0F18_01595 [Streptomyces sp. NPDC029216]|uniref:hypothetical protein n=1 Tax=Streptomyces sp. NPDC029216 TaxID=3154701 RepID=UPI00340BFCC6